MNDKLQKTAPTTNGLVPGASRKATQMPGLHRNLQAAAKQSETLNPTTLPNRIALCLDISGSMHSEENGKAKLDHLKDACTSFVGSCNFTDTSVCIETFSKEVSQELTTIGGYLISRILTLQGGGGTPMGAAMESVLMNHPVTRVVIVSDGEATDGDLSFEIASKFAEASIPCDTVHIGYGAEGEGRLKKIADMTGGLFIKFDNVANFAKNFKFLTPAFRGMLTAGGAAALGAKEIK
jgi:uncharacterized protein YegL